MSVHSIEWTDDRVILITEFTCSSIVTNITIENK